MGICSNSVSAKTISRVTAAGGHIWTDNAADCRSVWHYNR